MRERERAEERKTISTGRNSCRTFLLPRVKKENEKKKKKKQNGGPRRLNLGERDEEDNGRTDDCAIDERDLIVDHRLATFRRASRCFLNETSVSCLRVRRVTVCSMKGISEREIED